MVSENMLFYVDNQEVISQNTGEASSLNAKHADVRLNLLCDFLCLGVTTACYIKLDWMFADLMTKALDAMKIARP